MAKAKTTEAMPTEANLEILVFLGIHHNSASFSTQTKYQIWGHCQGITFVEIQMEIQPLGVLLLMGNLIIAIFLNVQKLIAQVKKLLIRMSLKLWKIAKSVVGMSFNVRLGNVFWGLMSVMELGKKYTVDSFFFIFL